MNLSLNPYVTFDGNCEKAVTFWAKVLEIEPQIMRMGDSPMPVPPGSKNRVMHATLRKAGFVLMASDSMPGQPVAQGNNVSLSIAFTDKNEQTKVWEGLLENGIATMPLGDQFFGRFGMLKDQFGIHWMLICEPPKP